LGVAQPLSCHLFFFLNFFKKISIFIYFIKMDMSVPCVAIKMATRGADVAFDGIC
jgi:hypothetical protein